MATVMAVTRVNNNIVMHKLSHSSTSNHNQKNNNNHTPKFSSKFDLFLLILTFFCNIFFYFCQFLFCLILSLDVTFWDKKFSSRALNIKWTFLFVFQHAVRCTHDRIELLEDIRRVLERIRGKLLSLKRDFWLKSWVAVARCLIRGEFGWEKCVCKFVDVKQVYI